MVRSLIRHESGLIPRMYPLADVHETFEFVNSGGRQTLKGRVTARDGD
jgi:hypothetical protein